MSRAHRRRRVVLAVLAGAVVAGGCLVALVAVAPGVALDGRWLWLERGWWGVACAGGGALLWGLTLGRRRAGPGRACVVCGYDMGPLPGAMTCPECGWTARSEREFLVRRVRASVVWPGVALLTVGTLLPTGFAVRRHGWAGGLPDWAIAEWVARVDGPPQPVLAELLRRMRLEGAWVGPGGWEGRLTARRGLLAERVLTGGAGGRAAALDLLVLLPPDAADRSRALVALASDDPRRRAGGAVLLAEMGGGRSGVRVPVAQLREVIESDDGEAQSAARYIVLWQSDAVLDDIVGVGPGPGAVRDAGAIRYAFDLLLEAPVEYDRWERLERLTTHYDAGVADRAVLLMAGIAARRGAPPPGLLRRALAAHDRLTAAGVRVARYGRPASWMLGAGARAVESLLDDPDAGVRLRLCRLLRPGEVIERSESWDESVEPWREMLSALERRRAAEPDDGVRQELSALIESIVTPPPGQAP